MPQIMLCRLDSVLLNTAVVTKEWLSPRYPNRTVWILEKWQPSDERSCTVKSSGGGIVSCGESGV